LRSGLKRKCIVALLHDMSKLPKREIEATLHNLEIFKRYWTEPK
jgi:hypothetical protein